MPLLLDSNSRADAIVDAVSRLILTGGIDALSLRAIAQEVGIAAGTLSYQFESRKRLMRVTAGHFTRRRLRAMSARLRSEGVLALLPADEDGVRNTRVWLAWCEIGRNDPDVDLQVRGARRDEQAFLNHVAEGRLSETALVGLGALIQGLRDAICAADRPVPPDLARMILRVHLDTALASVDDEASQSCNGVPPPNELLIAPSSSTR